LVCGSVGVSTGISRKGSHNRFEEIFQKRDLRVVRLA